MSFSFVCNKQLLQAMYTSAPKEGEESGKKRRRKTRSEETQVAKNSLERAHNLMAFIIFVLIKAQKYQASVMELNDTPQSAGLWRS